MAVSTFCTLTPAVLVVIRAYRCDSKDTVRTHQPSYALTEIATHAVFHNPLHLILSWAFLHFFNMPVSRLPKPSESREEASVQWRPQGAAGAASGGLESSWAQLFRSEGARREVLLAFLSDVPI